VGPALRAAGFVLLTLKTPIAGTLCAEQLMIHFIVMNFINYFSLFVIIAALLIAKRQRCCSS
jgi:hypothetical protein